VRAIICALPAVVGAYILGELAHAWSTAAAPRAHVIGNEAVLVSLAAIAACALVAWLTRGKGKQKSRSRRSRPSNPYSY
jgi:hypothetical protein